MGKLFLVLIFSIFGACEAFSQVDFTPTPDGGLFARIKGGDTLNLSTKDYSLSPSGTIVGGTVSNGNLQITKIGRTVQIRLQFDIADTPSAGLAIFSGAIPDELRPPSTTHNVHLSGSTTVRYIQLEAGGDIRVYQRNWAGTETVFANGSGYLYEASYLLP